MQDPNIGGVYGDGVYGESVTGEILQENMDKSYRQTVTELKWAIDQNMSFLADYVERLRGADQATYFAFRKEFLETAAQYKHDLDAANNAGENATATEKKAYINNLNIMKNYTTESVKNVQKIMNRNPSTADAMSAVNTSVLDNDANPLNRKLPNVPMDSGILRMPAPARPGAMGDYRTTSGNMGETVQMVNVGPLRAWWNGLGDSTKTTIKIAAVAAAIFGGDLLYKKFFKKEEAKKDKVEVEADSLLGDLDEVDDTNELGSGEFGTDQHDDDLDDDLEGEEE